LTKKVIAIHQPNYLPWAGYFLKMAACDVFVFHDNVQITKAGPTRRVKIASRYSLDKTQWLTVPLNKHSDYALIKDLEISWETDWTQKHINQIKDAYIQCPYFDDFFPKLVGWYQEAKRFTSLSQMNVFFIKQIMYDLDIKKEIHFSSQLPVSGKASAYNLAISKHLNGSHYLSGLGGNNYQDEIIFHQNNIQVNQIDSKALLRAHQLSENINPSLSIVEMLMKVDLTLLKKMAHIQQ
jgi:hypothetical protein